MANTNLTQENVATFVAAVTADHSVDDKVAQLIQSTDILNQLLNASEDAFRGSDQKKKFETLLQKHGYDKDTLNRACEKISCYQDPGE